MVKVGVIAGEVNEAFGSYFNEMEEFSIEYKNDTLEGFKRDLKGRKRSELGELDSILVLDYAFKGKGEDIADRVAEEFVDVQEIMGEHSMDTKLYLVTRDEGLYKNLQGEVKGVSGTNYHNVQIIRLNNAEYPLGTIRSVLLGEWDNQYLYKKGEQEDQNEGDQDNEGTQRESYQYSEEVKNEGNKSEERD